MIDKIKKEIAVLISKASNCKEELALKSLEECKSEFGDITSKIAFLLAKELKEDPKFIAQKISKRIGPHKFIEKIEVKDAYINFFLSDEFFSEALFHVNEKRTLKKEKVIVEFPSVNPNKPWHIGHLRNALIGDSISKILEFEGWKVERIDYIDDLGLQVAQSFYGYLKNKTETTKKFDHFVGEEYVKIVNEVEKSEEEEKKVREILKKIEEGEEIREEARKFCERVVLSQYQTAFNFKIYHDVLIFESDIVNFLFKEGLNLLKEKKVIEYRESGKNAGCWVLNLDEERVIIRSDGTSTYTGKDIVFHLWKIGKLKSKILFSKFVNQPNGEIAYKSDKKGEEKDFGNASIVLNVIGMEQALEQKIVKEALKRAGFEKEAEKIYHIAYEHVTLQEGAFSGRKGTWIGYTADELLEEGIKKVKERSRDKNLSDNDIRKIAIGAIKFFLLKVAAEKKIVFEWEKALSLDGDSGPYVQYACVRANRILEKVEVKEIKKKKYNFEKEERELIKKIIKFEEIVEKSAKDLKVYYIAEYCLDLASEFNKFYAKFRVLDAPQEEKDKRLLIVKLVKEKLEKGFELLGIEMPSMM